MYALIARETDFDNDGLRSWPLVGWGTVLVSQTAQRHR